MLDCQVEKAAAAEDKAARPRRQRVKFMSIRQHLEVQRVQNQEKQDPDNWFVRKFIVGIVAGVFGYSYYVYVVRLCIPMIRMEDDRLGGQAQGLVYLVIYHVLFVMFIWTYLVAVVTPPGFAQDYVPETEPPRAEENYIAVTGTTIPDQREPAQSKLAPADLYRPTRRREVSQDSSIASLHSSGRAQYSQETGDELEMQEGDERASIAAVAPSAADDEEMVAETAPTAGAFGPALGTALVDAAVPEPARLEAGDAAASSTQSSPEAGERRRSTASTTLVPSDDPYKVVLPKAAHVHEPARPRAESGPASSDLERTASHHSYLHFPEPPPELEPPKPLAVERIPRSAPVLTEQYRYDPRERIVRPYRSHRCKHCAKVVLKMDHHCPWVGSCVGARNYKYFFNFLEWSTAYLFFVFLTLVIAQTLPLGTFTASRPYPGVDGQQIAIIALSFFFLFFTSSLLIQHTDLVLKNMTTIEQIGLARMLQRERAALSSEYGFWGFRPKRETRREWDKRWGRPGREGNLWWLGSKRANWEMVFGQSKLGWFLPIPARPTMDDGLHYVPNPRFSPEGYWRERRFWPAELR
ncbi:hypothetical protein JCM8202_002104 [Rhodotorula sphaerocarpa]